MESTPPVTDKYTASTNLAKEKSDSIIAGNKDKNIEHDNVNQASSSQKENTAIPCDVKRDKNDEEVVSSSKTVHAAPDSDVPSPKSQTDDVSVKEVSLIDEDSIASTSKTYDTISSNSKSSELYTTEYLRNKYGSYGENAVASSSKLDVKPEYLKRKHIDLYGPDEGPKMYNVKGNLVTPPIIAKNLTEIFNYLPIYGKPKSKDDLDSFHKNKIREFVGFDMNDEKFENLAKICSPEYLRTGKELMMTTPYPTLSMMSVMDKDYESNPSNLCIVKKYQLRVANDPTNNYHKRLKYRGVRLMPLSQIALEGDEGLPQDLEPGKDIIYHVRIYRPFAYNVKEKQGLPANGRHSVFSRSVVLPGSARLSALRDRLVCANDAGVRVDVSAAPAALPTASAKDLFPSGFLFINNTFYVDSRGRCADRSEALRSWARGRGLGDFPRRDLHETRLEEVTVRLGYPEVYVHQGNCEHLFTFSEIRLLSAEDPLSSSQYPCHTAISQNQSVYCTTCAEFGAKWIVTGCATVPFDPAFFCETCLKMYLYKDEKKVGDFKAYSYRGNEINMLKPQG